MKKHYNIGKDNPMYGKHPIHRIGMRHTEEAKAKCRIAKIGELNSNWKDNQVGYTALHTWVTSRKVKPLLCEICGKRPSLDLASKDHKYTRNLNEWQWLCRRCHMEIDGRLKRLHILRRQRRWSCLPAKSA